LRPHHGHHHRQPRYRPAGVDTAKKLGLLPEEFDKIKEILGRQPNFTELSIFSAMWSEHCSYKNSIKQLKTLPRSGPKLLAEAGQENAGLVDIGDGWACAFKIESHNHPSAIEPYQGAATGVGGINRDIFTMGARPIAQLNSLRFGDISTEARSRWHMRGVVKGIGDYGNAFGVPVLGGEVYFDPCYTTNPLVNAMSVGIVRTDRVISATSHGKGNPVFIVGSSTGKDGIHGASFASKDITETSMDDLPAVQVGDPFMEKLLLEASLELSLTDAIIGMQDMGAAGITCSTSEMSAKGRGRHGHPPGPRAYASGRHACVGDPAEREPGAHARGGEERPRGRGAGHLRQVGPELRGDRHRDRWRQIRYYMHGELVAEVPAESLVLGGGAPVYTREQKEPAYSPRTRSSRSMRGAAGRPESRGLRPAGQPQHRQQALGVRAVRHHGAHQQHEHQRPQRCGLVLVKETGKGLAVSWIATAATCTPTRTPGAMIAVSEAARNIACTGGEPCGVTNCLNFGNPYDPEVYWQFAQVIKGMGDACRAFETPLPAAT
jgi:phosphoribosylformylglycinamidine synthase subunit PurL